MQANQHNSTELDAEWESSLSDDVRFGDQPSEQFYREMLEGEEQRQNSLLSLLRPAVLLPLLTNWTEEWFLSRNPFLIAAGIPFMALTVWLGIQILGRAVDQQKALTTYNTILAGAKAAGDQQTSELCMRALIGLDPEDSGAKMQLAELLWNSDRRDLAWQSIVELAESGDHGFPPAHMWIVQNARSEKPWQPVSTAQQMQHLLHILAVQPRNAEARALLAELYSGEEEWQLAEQHLTAAAEVSDEWLVPLIELQRMLGKQQVASGRLQEYEQKLMAGIARDSTDVSLKLRLAQVLALQNRTAEAAQLIENQRTVADSAELRNYHSELLLAYARQLLDVTVINRDRCLSLVMQSLQLNPDSIAALQLAVDLEEMGAICPTAQSATLYAHWKTKATEATDQSTQTLGQILAAALDGRYSEAADRLQPLVSQQPQSYPRLVFWLMQAGRNSDAAALAADIASKAREKEATELDRLIAAECLSNAGNYGAARRLLANDGELPQGLLQTRVYGLACIYEFDTAVNRPARNRAAPSAWLPVMPGGNESARLLVLLRTAAMLPAVKAEAIDRLARISLLDAGVATRSEDLLLELRSTGTDAENILLIMGTVAMLNERYGKAIDWLQQANTIAMNRNPIVLNNLALSVARSESGAGQNALNLINQALELLPENPELLSTRGEIFVILQRWADARRDLEESLRIRGSRPKVHRLLQQVWIGLNDPQQAETQQQLADQLEAATAP